MGHKIRNLGAQPEEAGEKMNLQQQLAIELRRRTQLLPQEMAYLKKVSSQAGSGMGIHQSQIEALEGLLRGLLSKQTERMKVFDDPDQAGAIAQAEFAERRADVELGLTGTHSIMATFQYVFDQRASMANYAAALNAADLIAAYCYLPCMKMANEWKGSPQGSFREPPLTYLNARATPFSVMRHKSLDILGLKLYEATESKLPIPIISLSFHNTVVFWTYCSLYHEVGHLLDQDLGLRAALEGPLQQCLGDSVNKNRWGQWLKEIIADVFGVLLGGSGFAYSLMGLLFNAPEEVIGVSGTAEHPNSYVRMLFVSTLLRHTNVPALGDVAGEIEATWRTLYAPPDSLKTLVEEGEKVAEAMLDTPLDILGGRCLRDFARGNEHDSNAPDSRRDHAQVLKLAEFLRFELDRPTPHESLIRLVPAAAQMALRLVESNYADLSADIHQRALEFIAALPHPDFLGEDSAKGHEEYMAKLIENFNFTAPDTGA